MAARRTPLGAELHRLGRGGHTRTVSVGDDAQDVVDGRSCRLAPMGPEEDLAFAWFDSLGEEQGKWPSWERHSIRT